MVWVTTHEGRLVNSEFFREIKLYRLSVLENEDFGYLVSAITDQYSEIDLSYFGDYLETINWMRSMIGRELYAHESLFSNLSERDPFIRKLRNESIDKLGNGTIDSSECQAIKEIHEKIDAYERFLFEKMKKEEEPIEL